MRSVTPIILSTLIIMIMVIKLSSGSREVLIRDRLVLVLCDQIDSYLRTGMLPPPIRKMPAKYKNVTAGPENGVRMNGFKVIFPGDEGATHKKGKRDVGHRHHHHHPILDFVD